MSDRTRRPPPSRPAPSPEADPDTPRRRHRRARRARDAPGDDPLRGSRTSGIWAAVVGLGVVLILLIDLHRAEHPRSTSSFLGWSGAAPLAVSLLIATAAGLFLATIAGSLRILQLRRRVRRDARR